MLTKDGKFTYGDWVRFVDEGKLTKRAVTHKFSVWTREGGKMLGIVRWFPAWRCYCFFPVNAVLEKTCLRDIAEFIETETKIRKDK